MALLLFMDTAGETAIAGLSDDDKIIAFESNADQKNHASFIQLGLHKILQNAGISFTNIQAVSVVNGPGSYTGLRVGLATAKGICYALNKPLILLNTLTVMASAAIDQLRDPAALYCPLIDARRNEVFMAMYDADLNSLLQPQPLILEPESFTNFLDRQRVVFFGTGHNKCGKIISHDNAVFREIFYSGNDINKLSQEAYRRNEFADIAYCEPFYTKDFFSVI